MFKSVYGLLSTLVYILQLSDEIVLNLLGRL